MSLQLVRIAEALPEGFEALRLEADTEGHRHMSRLAREWADGVQRFDGEGEALLAAYVDGDLAGFGGLTLEPASAPEPALRMRRLYVARAHRRRGVARALTSALLQEGLARARLITVHAGGGEAAAFWEAMGFEGATGEAWSHALRA